MFATYAARTFFRKTKDVIWVLLWRCNASYALSDDQFGVVKQRLASQPLATHNLELVAADGDLHTGPSSVHRLVSKAAGGGKGLQKE